MKTKAIFAIYIALISVFLFNNASAQTAEIMSSPSGVITLHTNLQHYLTGESILFTAYIQKEESDNGKATDISLYTAVLDQEGDEVTNGIFPVKNGRAQGELYLSEQLNDGNYILTACLSQIKKSTPRFIFSKIIRVERSVKASFRPVIQLTDTLYKPGSLLKATISFFGNSEEIVPVSYEYKLTNGTGEVLSGKGKSEKNTPSSLSLTLPSFKNDDKIVLYISAAYKGIKRNTGIIIPTLPAIRKANSYPLAKFPQNNSKKLKISIKTGQPVYGQTEKIEAEILVTDSKGSNVSTNLSVSANNIEMSPQMQAKEGNIISESGYNILWYDVVSVINDTIPQIFSGAEEKTDQNGSVFSAGMRNLYAGYLSSVMQSPGRPFLVQEKNDLKKINNRKAGGLSARQVDYSSERSIYDILMKVKPYTLVDNKIIFPSSGITSLNNQDGALVVIDGVKFGTDARALTNVAVSDIAKITASTNTMDVQKYSALNSVGIVEVFTKTGATTNTNETVPVITDADPLFWQSDLKTNFFGKTTISFYNTKSSPVKISVAGINENGETGTNSIVVIMK
jgi:hypothetical protein